MIRCFHDTDYYVARQLFEGVFHFSELVYFTEIWKERMESRSFGIWLDGVLIGMALVRGQKLEYLCIDPKHQSRGWGSLLLRHVMDNSPSLYLVPADDIQLCKWYEKNGFHLSHQDEMKNYTMRCYVRHPHITRSIARRKKQEERKQ
jgi:ribosomal protein S18 acetylase RimI-like enzyme